MRDAVRLDEAYDDLTREAYAVWIRLQIVPDHELRRFGLIHLAEKFRYRQRQFGTVMRQLRNKGYVRYQAGLPGVPANIQITKRPLLVGFDRFIKLT